MRAVRYEGATAPAGPGCLSLSTTWRRGRRATRQRRGCVLSLLIRSASWRQLLATCTAAALVLGLLEATPRGAHALPVLVSADLAPSVRASAADEDPRDGTFDTVFPWRHANGGVIVDSAVTERRVALEFELPDSVMIGSAQLRFVVAVYERPRQIEIHSYAGDGVSKPRDFTEDELVGVANIDSEGASPLTVDVTAMVGALVQHGETHAGFNLREHRADARSSSFMKVPPTSTPVLSIEYIPVAPMPMWIHGTAAPGSFIIVFVGDRACGGTRAEATLGLWIREVGSTSPCAPRPGEPLGFSVNGVRAPVSAALVWAPGVTEAVTLPR